MKKNSSTGDLKMSSNERLFLETNSLFRPKKYLNLAPRGLKIYTFNAGFKKVLEDLLIIVFEKVVNSAYSYSKTSTPSAPLIWGKKYNRGKTKAVIVNSGNANAHTGIEGLKLIDKYVSSLSSLLNCKKNQILVSSTGVIGELFEPDLILKCINKININKSNDILNAAKSIMTTDTYPKVSIKKIEINKCKFNIYGIAKGSGMISPNMGTMLAYIFIEASVPIKLLKNLLKHNIENTFNSISVDSDTSTSDTLALFSLNQYEINLNKRKNYDLLNSALYDVMRDLSLKIIKDGEGLYKLIKVNVCNSKSKKQAKNIAFSIINSPLVKTAITGEDANWGRIIMAIGKTEEKINQNKIKIKFGNILLCKGGAINKKINYEKLNLYMKNHIVEIFVDINNGIKEYTAYGNNLTNQYININSNYRS